MSYWINIDPEPRKQCETCGQYIGEPVEAEEIGNVTRNVSRIIETVWKAIGFDLVGIGDRTSGDYSWQRLDGHRLEDVKEKITDAWHWLIVNEESQKKLNAKNGWGDTGSVLRILRALIVAADEGVKGKIVVTG